MRKVLLFIFMLLPVLYCSGQTDTSAGEANDYLYDFQLSDNDEIESNEFLFENSPVNVNTASLQTLMQLPGIDYTTASKIVAARNRNGRFFSLTELQKAEGLDIELIRSLLPYIILFDEITYASGTAKSDSGRTVFNIKADIRSGFSARQYPASAACLGPAYRQYNKLRLNGTGWKASLRTEKDQGESEITDFKSFFVQINNKGIINSFTAGDYYIEFGQGLSRWSPGRSLMGRGADFNARSGRGVVPASGFNETAFLRGLSLELKYRTLCLTGFVSSVNRDAEKDTAGFILSLPQDGYHRTLLESGRKGSCRELTYGLLARFSPDTILTAGVIYTNNKYNYPVKPTASDESINSISTLSADYSLNLSKLQLNGEAVYEIKRLSLCNIITYEVLRGVNVVFRQISENWENGIILNAGLPLPGNVKVNELQTGLRGELSWGVLYLFYYNKSVRKPGGSVIHRTEGGLTFSGSLGKSFNGVFKFNFRNEKSEFPGAVLSAETKKLVNIRADLKYKAGNDIYFHWRADYCRLPETTVQNSRNGFAFYNETKFKLSKNILILTRLTAYKTDGYDSRLYEIESDVSGTLYSSLLYGSGAAWYIITELTFWKNAKVAAKYADETKNIKQSVNGSIVNYKRFSMQIDFSF